MPLGIFSTYSTGENRVTSTLLAVLRCLALHRAELLLGTLLGEDSFSLVSFRDQATAKTGGVPDAEIFASACLLIETKIAPNSVGVAQIERHLRGLSMREAKTTRLLVLTPDDQEPVCITAMNDDRVKWINFALLHASIDSMFENERDVISERETFLLREFQALLERERLVGPQSEVLVVAAREAWVVYPKAHAYICQPGRSFRRSRRMAFYADKAIRELVPTIEAVHDDVTMDPDAVTDLRLRKAIEGYLEHRPDVRGQGAQAMVMLLSSPESERTLVLKAPVDNDLATDEGRTIAFVQGQRYITERALKDARTTSDLLD